VETPKHNVGIKKNTTSQCRNENKNTTKNNVRIKKNTTKQ
jgi:hypothetical protein